MRNNVRRKVALIVPAFNEAGRISAVLRAATAAKLVNEVIVVADGCRDNTADVARKFGGVKVVELSINQGKGAAMYYGVKSSDADIVAFADADLSGLTGEHIDDIIRPILNNQCDMCIGVFRGGKFWSDTAQTFAPYISGQRAMKRTIFDGVTYMPELRFGAEAALNMQAKRMKARVLRVVIRGVSNCFKETKMGLGKGLKARRKMYVEIAQAVIKDRRRRKPPRASRWK